jgi:lysine 6-dehydrogenase
MSFRYVVLGAGRQGTAIAYDLGRHGDAASVVVADADEAAAQQAADRVNELLGRAVALPLELDGRNREGLATILADADCVASALPYPLNPMVTEVAIEQRAHMCDLGGNTDLVREQLARHAEAEAAGVSVIPDCGQVPGMGTTLMVLALSMLDEPEGVVMWDGGLPQHPQPPWNYALTFNIGGLTNEYFGDAIFLRNSRVTEVPCFDPANDQRVVFPEPWGELEAFVTAGGTSTMPWTFEGKIQTIENRTLRYPGHAAMWRTLVASGLLEQEPIEVAEVSVAPRDVLHALLETRLRAAPETHDVVLIRIEARGRHQGRPAVARLELIDTYDEATGFTAMQRTTGFDAAIVAAMMARGETPRGAVPVELSVDPERFATELAKRDISLEREVVFEEG